MSTNGSVAVLDVADGEYEADPRHGLRLVRIDNMEAAAATIVASGGFPVRPPRGWYNDPKLDGPTPLTVLASGQAFGHIATWRQSHIAMAGSAVKPPKSKSGYAFFATGVLECDDGSMVDVGQITLAGGHASLDVPVQAAVEHYANTESAVLDVAIGEDRHGIWVAGSVRPNVEEADLRTLRASAVSGDWRPINGRLELVAVCAVNTPGFPIPRVRVASGAPMAMVAAGTSELVEIAIREAVGGVDGGVLAALEQRVAVVESVLSGAVQGCEGLVSAALTAGRAMRSGRDEIAAAKAAALRSRVQGAENVWSDGFPMVASLAACRQSVLRQRMSGGLTAAAADEATVRRAAAAESGVACNDGSFPIGSVADWYAALPLVASATPDQCQHMVRRGRVLGVDADDLASIVFDD